ncbi:MAG TPA: DUF3857 domain-containing protein [Verrucomicrobiales bacterium]|nr:DUF3857 domain-containing protein [Verrucomicrobiales bacterium]
MSTAAVAPVSLPEAQFSRTASFAFTPDPPPSRRRQYIGPMLKGAAAVLTLSLVVFLKLDRLFERWYDSHRRGGDESEAQILIRKTPSLPQAEVINSLSLHEHFNFQPQELREFPDLNFRFLTPEDAWDFGRDPWSREGSVFSLTKVTGGSTSRQEIGKADFALRVLPMGVETTSDQNRAATAVQAAIQALGTGCRITGREDVKVNGLLFSRIEVEDLMLSHERTNAEMWLYPLNGIVYEMITAMPARTPAYYLSQTARRLAEGFSIIDPTRFLRSADVTAMLETAGAVPVQNPPVIYGNVTLGLKPGMWNTWPGAEVTLSGSVLGFTSRGGVRIAAAFAPNEGLPDDPARTASLIGVIWPALRDFQWGRVDRRPHHGQRAATLRGTGSFNSRAGKAEVRAVRCGQSLMMLFAFAPGDIQADQLAASLDLFKVDPGANGDPDFGVIEERAFHRSALAGYAEDATANGRHEEACNFHRVLFEFDRRPDDLCNAARSLAAAGKRDDALNLISTNEGRNAGDQEWEAQKMLLLASIGHAEESRRIAVGLLKNGGLAGTMAAVYIETLMEAKAWREAREFVKLLSTIDSSPVWHLYNALLMAETGERSRAAAVVRAVRGAKPDDVELSVECVNVLMRCRLLPEALELARFLALKNPAREQLQLLSASCETALGHTTEAREAYQKILEANPGSVLAREALSSLAASTGQDGTQEIVNANIPAVPLPAGLAAKLPKAWAPLVEEGGQSVVHLYRVTGVQLHAGQPLRETVRGAIRVLDEEGMSVFNTMHFSVQPQSQRLCIHYLQVLDGTGHPVAEAKLRDHYSLDGASSGMAASGKVIHLPVPGLTPGCTIHYAYTIENAGAASTIEYNRHVFALPEPCRLDTWFITGDTAKLKFASTRHRQPDRDGDSLVWMETKPALLNNALLAGGNTDELPVLHIGTPSVSWDKLGRDYLDQIRDRLATNTAVTHAAQDAIAGLRTREERIAAISALVRETISYTAIEFGARAINPNAAAVTLANRYGDCKDQSVLLHQLFNAVAIPSRLCLVNSRGSIHREFPCMSQFDHMIVALPVPGSKNFDFIDPTNKYLSPVPGTAPMQLESRTTLVLDPAGPVLADTPAFSPPSEVVLKRELEFRGTDDAVFNDVITLTGSHAARLRSQLAPLAPNDRTAMLRQLIGFDRLSHRVGNIRILNIKELHVPLRIAIQWEARRCLHSEHGILRLDLPAVIENHFLAADTGNSDEDTGTPLQLTSALTLRSEVSLHVPPGRVLNLPPGLPVKTESSFGNASLTATPADAKRIARISWECTVRPGNIPQAQKRSFVDFTHDSLRRLQGDWEFGNEAVVRK